MSEREKYLPDETVRLEKKKPHLTEYAGIQYDVDKLEATTVELPTSTFSLNDRAELEDVLEGKYWHTSDGQSIGPSDLLGAFEESNGSWEKVRENHPEWSVHIDKVIGVDYARPSLVFEGHLIDGIHRLTKALSEKASSIPVKVLKELSSDAEYKN